MFCTNCGNQIPDGAKFCTACGAPVEQPTPMSQSNQAEAVYEQAPVRAAAPVRASQQPNYQQPQQQQPQAYQVASQAVPAYTPTATKAKSATKWPVSTGVMGILHLLFYLVAQIPMYIYYDQMGIPSAMLSWSRIIYIIVAFAVPVLFFVHTKKIAILTAIPMIVVLIMEGISTFSNFRYMGSSDMVYSMLTFIPMLILTVLYVIQMLVRSRSAALPVIYLIFAIITIVLTFIINIRYFASYTSYMTYIAITMLVIWFADLFAYVAYMIAMFSSRKK